jgi:Flp pilus assembly protein TadB
MASQDERNRELQRQVEKRLRELETHINDDSPFHQTVKHQPTDSQKPWMKKAILGGKLFAIAVATLVAVRVASVVAGVVMFAALVWLAYKLFFESQTNKR